MTEADNSENLAARLEILPRTRRSAANNKLEAERTGIPWLVGERALLVLGIEGADGGEIDAAVAGEHRKVQTEARRRDGAANGEHGNADLAACLDAHVRLH